MPIRIGIIIGCADDAVEDRKYVGNVEFLQDLPDKYRIDPKSDEYLVKCAKGTKGVAHADVAIAWHIQKHNADIAVDMIYPEDLSVKRLRANDCNFLMGYDIVNSVFEGMKRWKLMEKIFKTCGNLMPPYPFQEHIYYKSRYLMACKEAGVPIAPTIIVSNDRSVPRVIEQIKARGWTTFVVKQSFSAFGNGFMKLKTEELIRKPHILETYFEKYPNTPEFIFQEAILGFRNNWETRCFWFKGEFLYAIANKAALSSPTGKEIIVTGDDIPAHFLKEAKRVGKMVLDSLPPLTTPQGKLLDACSTLIRTDIGCSDTRLDDKDYASWKPRKKTFFLNELEFGSINLFIRHLKFDAIPLWSEKLAEASREICAHDGMQGRKRGASLSPEGEVKKRRTRSSSVKKA